MRIYGELAPWFHLLTHPDEYTEEAAHILALARAACRRARPGGRPCPPTCCLKRKPCRLRREITCAGDQAMDRACPCAFNRASFHAL